MTTPLLGISSMATRALLAELAREPALAREGAVAFESIGGVDAARRVAAGEAFDLVVLARDALERLQADGHLRAGSIVDLVRSNVAIAVRAGTAAPDVSSEAALRRAVEQAPTIGHSTGPSGTALLALFERWGIADALRPKIVQARPGVPVARLVADGDVVLGFQQRSEMLGVPGIDIVGAMPAAVAIETIFSGAVAARAARPDAAARWLAAAAAPATAVLKQRHGMEPA